MRWTIFLYLLLGVAELYASRTTLDGVRHLLRDSGDAGGTGVPNSTSQHTSSPRQQYSPYQNHTANRYIHDTIRQQHAEVQASINEELASRNYSKNSSMVHATKAVTTSVDNITQDAGSTARSSVTGNSLLPTSNRTASSNTAAMSESSMAANTTNSPPRPPLHQDPPRPPPGLSLKAVGHSANATNTSATSSTSGSWKSPPSPVSNTSPQDINGSTMNSNSSLNSSSSIYAQSSFTGNSSSAGNSSSGVGAGSNSTPSPPTPSPSEQLANTSASLNTTGGSTAEAIGYSSSDSDDSSDDRIDGSSSSAGSDRSGNSTTNSDSRLGSSNSSDGGTSNSSSSSSSAKNSSGFEPSMGLSTPPQAASSSPPTGMLTSPPANPPYPQHSLPGNRHRTNGSGLRPSRHRRHRPPRPTPSTTFGEPTQAEGTPLPRQHSQAGGPLPGRVSSSSPPPPTSPPLMSGAGSTPEDPVLPPSLTTGGTPPPAGGHAAVALPPVTSAVPPWTAPDGSAGGEEAVPGHAPAALLLSPGGSVQGGADTHKPSGAAAGGVTVMATQAFTSVTEMAAAAGRWAVQEDIIMYTGSAAFVLVLVAGFLVSRRLGWQLRSPLSGSNRPAPGGPSSGPSRASQPYLPLSSAPHPPATAAPVDGWDNWSDDEEAPGGQPGWGSSPASGPTAKKAQLKTGPGGTHYNSIPSTADPDPRSSAGAGGAGQGSGAPGVSRESAPLPLLSPRPARAALSIAAPDEPAARSGRTRPSVREDRAAASHRNGRRGGSNGIAGTATLGAGKGKAGSSSSLSLVGSDRGDSGTEAAPQLVGRGKLGAVKLKPTAPSAHRDDW